MAIMQSTIEQIRISSDIVSIAREYMPDLKRAGRNWQACCPFHNEKTPSFIVSPEKGIFKCFGCSAAGDVFKFVMLMENISWIEAVKKLAGKAGIAIKEDNAPSIKTSEKAKLYALLESTARFYHRCLLESSIAAPVREYLEKRGLTSATTKKFMIGYAPKGQLIQAAAKKGYGADILIKAGILAKATKFEYMSGRIVFPIVDVQGRVVAFGGRTITDQQPKYLNTPETEIYSKSSNLYGLFSTLSHLRQDRKIIIAEGYMDVVMPAQYAIPGVVATLGTALTPNHIKLIRRYADIVYLMFDADQAGREATMKALALLNAAGVECRCLDLPAGIDFDELLLKGGLAAFEDLKKAARRPIEWVIDHIAGDYKELSAAEKSKKVLNIMAFIKAQPLYLLREEMIRYMGESLEIDDKVLKILFR